MSYQLAAVDASPQRMVKRTAGAEIAAIVKSQEKLERVVPLAIKLAVIGLPLAWALLTNANGLILITIGVAIFVAVKIALWAARSLFLEPSRRARYNRAAAKLRGYLDDDGDVVVGPYSWTLGASGAIAMTRAGEVLIVDYAHDYRLLRLLPAQIAGVKVECNSRQFVETLHSGRTTVGGFSGSFGMGYTLPGRSTTVTNTVNEYFLEIQYQLEKNAMVSTVIVPGGADRRVPQELCATIRRLEA